jgi:hypothetical protein
VSVCVCTYIYTNSTLLGWRPSVAGRYVSVGNDSDAKGASVYWLYWYKSTSTDAAAAKKDAFALHRYLAAPLIVGLTLGLLYSRLPGT